MSGRPPHPRTSEALRSNTRSSDRLNIFRQACTTSPEHPTPFQQQSAGGPLFAPTRPGSNPESSATGGRTRPTRGSTSAAFSKCSYRRACAKSRRSVDRSVRWSKRRPAGTLRSRMLGLQATGRVAAPNAGAEMSGGTKRVPGTSATAGAVRLAACSTRCRRKVDEPRSAKCGGWAAFRPFALVSSGEGRPRSSAGSLRLIAEERGSSLVAQALPPPP